MDIEYVREFIKLFEAANFLEAADTLFISQSTLSRHLQILESELGYPLFNRTAKKTEINENGKLFLPYARQLVAINDQYMSVSQKKKKETNQQLSIGLANSIMQRDIATILLNFLGNRTSVNVNLIRNTAQKITMLVQSDKCDFAFLRVQNIQNIDFSFINLASYKIVAVFQASHRFAAAQSIHLEELCNETFMLNPSDELVYNLCVQACRYAGFNPKIRVTSRNHNIIEMAGKGLGVALLTKDWLTDINTSDVSIVDIVPAINTNICIVYKNDRLDDAGRDFLEYIKLSMA